MGGPFGWRTPPGGGCRRLPGRRPAPRCSACWRSCGRRTRRRRWSPGSGRSPGEPPRRSARFRPRRPLRVRGDLRYRGGARSRGRPARRAAATAAASSRVPGALRPTVRLRVELVPPLEILPTAAELATARDRCSTLQAGLGSVATSLVVRATTSHRPTPVGRAAAIYAYRTVRVARFAGGDAVLDGRREHARDRRSASCLGAAALVGLAVLCGALVTAVTGYRSLLVSSDALRARGRRRCRCDGGPRGVRGAAPKLPAADRAAHRPDARCFRPGRDRPRALRTGAGR